jgi:hypothetical protein
VDPPDRPGFSGWGITLNGANSHIELTHLTVIGGESGVHLTWGGSGQKPGDGPVSDIVLAHSLTRDPVYTAVDCTPGGKPRGERPDLGAHEY